MKPNRATTSRRMAITICRGGWTKPDVGRTTSAVKMGESAELVLICRNMPPIPHCIQAGDGNVRSMISAQLDLTRDESFSLGTCRLSTRSYIDSQVVVR